MTNPYLTPSAKNESPTQNRPPRRTKTAWWKTILASVSIIIGLFILLGGSASDESKSFYFLAAAFLLPSIWFFIREKADQISPSKPPTKKHWGVITMISVGLFFVGVFSTPSEPQNSHPSPVTDEPLVEESETSTVESSPTKSSESSASEAESAPVTTEIEEDTPGYQEKENNEKHGFIAPAQSPAPAYTPPSAPAYPPPAPAGGRTVHPGAFCNGGTGVSSTGKPMVCAPASDGRMRWQSA
ncbi:hypothetical protein GSS87_01635 [Corynebacterium sp. 4HC-13]|uniref:hypothetical protein n=1 Tax=Corynebacterium anserum TaxID=2684406 RepID=UPI00163A3380|nr:hypothetical protein [Corynebacterium anserum]MBC2681126.1 hypothetical protein [Corynebacterium anserum]